MVSLVKMDNQSIIVYRGGRSVVRGSGRGTGRGAGRGYNAGITHLNENLHQEFIKFLIEKNQNENKIENSLATTSEVSESLQLQKADNFKIDSAQFKEFGEKLDKLNKTMGFFRVIADVTIITSELT